MWKKTCLSMLSLCTLCVKQQSAEGWQILVKLILQCMHDSQTQNFYSLALLDSKLQCLLAAVNNQTADSTIIWQLLTAFHCETAQSFMGLSITRHTIMYLNKLLSLSQVWEQKWLCEQNLRWLPLMLASRDLLVRASTLQLLSGLTTSARGVGTILQLSPELLDSVLRTVVDHSEASIVREHAAVLMANIVKNYSSQDYKALTQAYNLFQDLRESVGLVALTPVTTHIDSSSDMLYTHPRFIKTGCWLINNLLTSSADDILEVITSSGLPTALCRTLKDVGKLDNCDLVSMFAAICKLLTHCSAYCEIIQLQDCLPPLTSLLDPANFVYDSDVMTKEVKTLWRQSFRLLSAVLTHTDAEFVLPESAVGTLCQCISDTGSTSLKITALQAVPAVTKYLTPRDEVVVCETLLSLWQSAVAKTRSALLSALAALLGHSSSATEASLNSGLLPLVLTGLKQIHLTLTVETSSTDKLKKHNPSLCQLVTHMTLLANFLYDSNAVKQAATQLEAADLLHKLWLWCQVDTKYLLLALDLLITFTANCSNAAHTFILTSTLPGVGQRKSPTSHSLVHSVISLLTREQHTRPVCHKALTLLAHCCQAHECRIAIAKSALLTRWSDQWADRKQSQEETEIMWLKFILVFTSTQEGQNSLPKTGELFNQLIQCAENGRQSCKPLAVAILRNLAANPANKTRFLGSKAFLGLLGEKLLSGSAEEKKDTALTIWALVSNHQKAKVALRSLGLVNRLQLAAATCDDDDEGFSFVADLLKPR